VVLVLMTGMTSKPGTKSSRTRRFMKRDTCKMNIDVHVYIDIFM
jgi:hypothetical protein